MFQNSKQVHTRLQNVKNLEQHILQIQYFECSDKFSVSQITVLQHPSVINEQMMHLTVLPKATTAWSRSTSKSRYTHGIIPHMSVQPTLPCKHDQAYPPFKLYQPVGRNTPLATFWECQTWVLGALEDDDLAMLR